MTTRHTTDDLIEVQLEPGSRGRILKNLQGIRSKRAMDALEALAQTKATDWSIRNVTTDQQFKAADIHQWHKQ